MVLKWSQLTDKSIPVVQRDVLQEVKPTVLKSLEQHSQETHVLDENLQDDHITTIIKKITFLYTKIFLHQFSKVYTERKRRSKTHILDNKCLELTKLPFHTTFPERYFHEEFSRKYTIYAQNLHNN